MKKLMVIAIMVNLSSCCIRPFAGASKGSPADLESLSLGAKKLLEQLYASLPKEGLVDCHIHVTGLPECGNDNYVNPHMRSFWHPIKRLKFASFKSAGGVKDEKKADAEYAERLLRLISGIASKGRYCVLALDKFYDEDGTERLDRTEFHVPNDYVWALHEKHPTVLEPVVSIHPYRKDAIDELKRWHGKGARMVKWLPNAMGIDPSHDKAVAFCAEMAALKMVLLTHTGQEDAIDGREFQHMGNPLLVRRILDTGLTVIMAHCGSTGKSVDLDDPTRKKEANFKLFARLMDDKRYAGNLFGDLSATTQFNRDPEDLKELLRRTEWHPRLINGSDYPLPAINFLIRTGRLHKQKLITKEQRGYLNEIYHVNPLLFDIAVKFCLRDPDSGKGFDPVVFKDPFAGRFPTSR